MSYYIQVLRTKSVRKWFLVMCMDLAVIFLYFEGLGWSLRGYFIKFNPKTLETYIICSQKTLQWERVLFACHLWSSKCWSAYLFLVKEFLWWSLWLLHPASSFATSQNVQVGKWFSFLWSYVLSCHILDKSMNDVFFGKRCWIVPLFFFICLEHLAMVSKG